MEFNEFLKKANEGYKLIPIIKEIESFDNPYFGLEEFFL